MKHFIMLLVAVALLTPNELNAQLSQPNNLGVTIGHAHLVVQDVAANIKFWSILGGVPMKIDDTDVIRFPGVFVFLTPGNARRSGPPPKELTMLCACPSDGIEPATINHLGFLIKDLDSYIARVRAAGVTVKQTPSTAPNAIVPPGPMYLLFSPDNLAVEVGEDKSIAYPVTRMQIHFFAPAFINELPHRVPAFQMYDWYHNAFGANLMVGNLGAELPGVLMRYSPTPLPTVPTKGRTVDHIGFEVNNLEEYVRNMEGKGMKFDKPYSKTRHKDFASAELTDPYGVSIELTEGLKRF